MKTWLLIGVLFALLYAWFWLIDVLVERGTVELFADDEPNRDVFDGLFVAPHWRQK